MIQYVEWVFAVFEVVCLQLLCVYIVIVLRGYNYLNLIHFFPISV